MRQTLSLGLVLLLVMQLGPPALGADNISSQIAGMPAGADIEVHLKTKQALRGTKGEVSGSGFILANPSTGNRQIAFDEVTSVKQLTRKSHKTRNILIITGVALGVVITVVAIHIKNCPVGCRSTGY
jgi:hypothetical protein